LAFEAGREKKKEKYYSKRLCIYKLWVEKLIKDNTAERCLEFSRIGRYLGSNKRILCTLYLQVT